MKRFYKDVTIADGAILLDQRPVRTPARAALILPTQALAEAIADEWRAQRDKVDPRSMPLTGFANAAIDRVAPDPSGFARPLALYAETDLLCYRATDPPDLIARQAEAWDPLLGWARRRYDVHFSVTAGIVHVAQPAATVARLGEALVALAPFPLAAMAPLVTIGGSLVVALALLEGEIGTEDAFAVTHLDEAWQVEKWGEDMFATQTREAHLRDFLAAARFAELAR
jgi:chaperone required for assembly of F1-ATPase